MTDPRSRDAFRLLPALALAFLLALGAGFSVAQDSLDEEAEPPPPPQVDVDEILRGEEEVLSGGGYSYDAGDRRDPFRSLLEIRLSPRAQGPRPKGVPGLLIDELSVTGVFITSDGPVAQVLSTDKNNSFLLHLGDQLYDGEVVSITMDEVVFRQIVDDPTALKPFREVPKKLIPES